MTLIFVSCGPDDTENPRQTLGEPTDTPTIFAQNLISSSSKVIFGVVRDYTNNEIYYTELSPSNGEYQIKVLFGNINNEWNPPVVASFSNSRHDASPSLTRNGDRIYFTSFRNSTISRVWYSDRKADKSWNDPNLVQFPDTITADIRNISFVNDSVFYFEMFNDTNDNDIYRGVISENACISIEHTGEAVNSQYPDMEPAVSSDESYMIFYSINRTGHIGSTVAGDLYISYKINENWSEPVNMGIPINSEREENWPKIDFENNVLYFSSNRSSSNGYPEIYWVKLDNYINQ